MAAEKKDAKLDPVEAALERMRHSTSHLLAAAVQAIWPEARFGVGPAIKHGFYYDILLPVPLGPPELLKIEKKMRELRNKKLAYVRRELPIDEAAHGFVPGRSPVTSTTVDSIPWAHGPPSRMRSTPSPSERAT